MEYEEGGGGVIKSFFCFIWMLGFEKEKKCWYIFDF